jgi:phospholipid/cholesterol/gamma-HCH transport system substrate-binding protein
MKTLGDAAAEAKETAHDARVLMAKLQAPTTDFATTGLPQITAAVIELQSAAESLERLVNEIQRSPSAALGKPAAKEMKVKP